MRVKLDCFWKQHLAGLPESGMGCQRVRVRLKNGRVIDEALAFNAQELELPADAPAVSLADILAIDLSSSRTTP